MAHELGSMDLKQINTLHPVLTLINQALFYLAKTSNKTHLGEVAHLYRVTYCVQETSKATGIRENTARHL